ncbi:DUF1330 domain-containing protein, partial [Sphingomonas sp. NFR15]|uniref:DUF1330 domain-containing protein n=1 Tax=Sphingomonas sp. NFR15 TaxID=1566282 RepID=UPI00088E8121
APDGVVVLEFPSVEEARAWYQSPGYQAALQHRLKATTYRVIITEGVSRFGPSRHGVEAHTARTRARYDTREMASISNLVVVGLQAAIRGPS